MANQKSSWGGSRVATNPDANRRKLPRVIVDKDTMAIIDMVKSSYRITDSEVVKDAVYAFFAEFVKLHERERDKSTDES